MSLFGNIQIKKYERFSILFDKIRDFLYNRIVMNERKLKVYLDTSVVSHLWQIDAPEKMKETLALWEEFKKDKFVR